MAVAGVIDIHIGVRNRAVARLGAHPVKQALDGIVGHGACSNARGIVFDYPGDAILQRLVTFVGQADFEPRIMAHDGKLWPKAAGTDHRDGCERAGRCAPLPFAGGIQAPLGSKNVTERAGVVGL